MHGHNSLPSQRRPFELVIERPLQIAKRDETALLRAAVARRPSAALRSKLALLLQINDEFDEAIEIYESLSIDAPNFYDLTMLGEALLARETREDDRRAVEIIDQALALAESDADRSAALATRGKALRRLGDVDAARASLVEAVAADPHNANAYKRIVTIDLERGNTEAVLETSDAVIERGGRHSRLLVARALALAKLGRVDEARDAVGLDSFLHSKTLAPPPDYASIEAFNADLKAELIAHPDLRYDRYGTASANTWRVDEPATATGTMVPALQEMIRKTVIDYVAKLDGNVSLWTEARPEFARLHNWCVMTDADGYELWHVHQHGWMSGVYYVDVPPSVTAGEGVDGCIAFGLPADLVGDEAAATYGERVIRPYPGLLMLFPSHTYHRTFAHGSDHRRICLAFDIQPH